MVQHVLTLLICHQSKHIFIIHLQNIQNEDIKFFLEMRSQVTKPCFPYAVTSIGLKISG